MLTSLHIKNFRGFHDLKVGPLARVNLIAGKNNVGKTGVLEALYLLFSNAEQFQSFPSAFRNSQEKVVGNPDKQEQKDNFASFWKWLPYKSQDKEIGQTDIKASISEDDAFIVTLDEQYVIPPLDNLVFHYQKQNSEERVARSAIPFSTHAETPKNWLRLGICSTRHYPPPEDADLFNSLNIKKKEKKLLEYLQVIEPRLEDLKYLKVGSEPLVYADVGLSELIPITQLGQGFARVFRFFSEMLIEDAKIILIDEIENGIHQSVLPEIWKGLAGIAREENLQIFATTHSWECIQAAHQVFGASGHYNFALHRLQRVKGKIQAVTHDQEMIEVAAETELEIR